MIKPTKTDNNLDWPLDSLLVLILLSALLICFQYITLEKFEVLSPLMGLNLSGILQTIQQAIPLKPIDFILSGLILMGFAILCVLEYRRKRVSLLLNKVFSVERHTRIALVLTSLILVRFYFARGAFHWTSDMGSHTTYAWIATRAFQRGEFPIWTNLLGNGSPYLQFYGPLFFYLVGLTGLVFRDPIFSIKLVLAGLHVLSGLGMYCLVKTLCGSRRAGFLSALAFVLSFWHTHQIMIMGRLPVSVFYALIPWPFYFFEQLRFRLRRIPATIGGALTLGLLPFVHPGYAFWATALLILYIVPDRKVIFGRERFKLLLFSDLDVKFESPLKTPIFKKIGQLGEISINKNNNLQR